MAASPRDPTGRGERRHAFVAFLLLLMPAFMFLGILAPGAVMVEYEEEEEYAQGPVTYRPIRLSKRPLLVPRDYSAGFVPELVDIESLFMDARYRAPESQRVAGLPSFQSSQGDSIVLDDVDEYVADDLFDDSMEPTLTVDTTPLWDPELFDIIPPTLSTDGHTQFDDFAGEQFEDPIGELTPPVVPEPDTGALLSLGVIGIAVRARLRRRA